MKIEEIMQQIAVIRKQKGVTQEVLADGIEKSAKFIGDIEIGRRKPSAQTFIDICTYLEIDMNSIMFGGDNNE